MTLIFAIIGSILIICGLRHLYKQDTLYQDSEGRNGSLKDWKSYAKTLGTRPMAQELELMDRDAFIKELATCYNIFLKEI